MCFLFFPLSLFLFFDFTPYESYLAVWRASMFRLRDEFSRLWGAKFALALRQSRHRERKIRISKLLDFRQINLSTLLINQATSVMCVFLLQKFYYKNCEFVQTVFNLPNNILGIF